MSPWPWEKPDFDNSPKASDEEEQSEAKDKRVSELTRQECINRGMKLLQQAEDEADYDYATAYATSATGYFLLAQLKAVPSV